MMAWSWISELPLTGLCRRPIVVLMLRVMCADCPSHIRDGWWLAAGSW
jgi:hypothetical protein